MDTTAVFAAVLVPPLVLSLGANVYLLRALRRADPEGRAPLWLGVFFPSPLAGFLAAGLFYSIEFLWSGDAVIGTYVALAITLALFLPLGLLSAIRVHGIRAMEAKRVNRELSPTRNA